MSALFVYLWFLGLNEVQVPSLENLLCASLMFNLVLDSQMGASQGIGPSKNPSPFRMKCVLEKDSYLSNSVGTTKSKSFFNG